jgi:hypothetical protein
MWTVASDFSPSRRISDRPICESLSLSLFSLSFSGTFSKKSRVISGRRPLARDPQVNYDYDSEAEWEEEDPEGEDIALSENEDDGEGDEIVYDDFFRPDHEVEDMDGGVSDADHVALPSGEKTVLACPSLTLAALLAHRMTVSGVRFIGSDTVTKAMTTSGDLVEVTSQDTDTETLLNYSALVHPSLSDSGLSGSTALPPRLCVGTPSRLAAFGVSLQRTDGAGGGDGGKETKDSRSFKESMVASRLRPSSLSSCSFPPWRCLSTARKRALIGSSMRSSRPLSQRRVSCLQKPRSRSGYWTWQRGERDVCSLPRPPLRPPLRIRRGSLCMGRLGGWFMQRLP